MNTRDIGNTLKVGGIRKSPCEIVEAVRNDLLTRSEVGVTKYGATLGENPASRKERLQHAYEEALDLANYLKWEIMKEEEMEKHDYAQFAQDIDQVANGHVGRINRPANYTIYAEGGTVMFKDIRNKQEPKAIGSVRG